MIERCMEEYQTWEQLEDSFPEDLRYGEKLDILTENIDWLSEICFVLLNQENPQHFSCLNTILTPVISNPHMEMGYGERQKGSGSDEEKTHAILEQWLMFLIETHRHRTINSFWSIRNWG